MSSPVTWLRSSFCGTNACVEVWFAGSTVFVRNSADTSRLAVFNRAEWRAFVEGVRAGEFEVPDA